MSLNDIAKRIGAHPSRISPLSRVSYVDDIEQDSPKETSAILDACREKSAAERKRFENATDSEFWFAVCFQTRKQKERFLQAMEWGKHGDKYLDGLAIARAMGVDIGALGLKPPLERRDKKLSIIPTIPNGGE
jgi:hypothetical protein